MFQWNTTKSAYFKFPRITLQEMLQLRLREHVGWLNLSRTHEVFRDTPTPV
jgi:hypothetical protein